MIRIEKCARRGFDAPASTISTYFEVLVVTSVAKTATVCAYDGGDRVRLQWTDEWRIVG